MLAVAAERARASWLSPPALELGALGRGRTGSVKVNHHHAIPGWAQRLCGAGLEDKKTLPLAPSPRLPQRALHHPPATTPAHSGVTSHLS